MIQRRLLFLRKFSLLFKQFVAYVKGDGGVVESVDYLYSKFTQAPNASILQIPTSYKTSVLYNQEPFNPSEDFDVIRNSNVFRGAPNGLLEEIGVNVPCIDYSTGEPLLLTQPQSTNFIRYSEDFTAWSVATAGILTSNATESPTGNVDATELLSIGTSESIYIESMGILSAGDYTYSIYVKYKDGDIKFNFRVGGAGSSSSLFLITENDVTLISSIERTSIENVGNGWFRVSVGFISNGIDSTNAQLRGDFELPYNGFYVWGAQVEQQPFATSYIPTNGSVATRLQDQIGNAGSTDTINSEQGVLYFEGAALTNVDGVLDRTIGLSDGTTDNRLTFKYDDTSNRVQFVYRKNLVNIAIVTINDFQVLEINSFALAWDDENLYAYINEVVVGEVALSDTFSANTLNTFNLNNGSGLGFYGKTKELRVYKSIAQAQIDLPYIT